MLFKFPCPLLSDNVCLAYDSRPVACRIYLSKSEESCKHEYSNPKDSSRFPDLYKLVLLLGRKLNEGFSSKLTEMKIDTREFPMEERLLK